MTEDLAPTTGPDDATPGAPDEEAVDVVVIGAGPVGENAAQYAHTAGGLEVALVEADLLGGECSYWACMPSKALLRPLEVAGAAAHLGGLTDPDIDLPGLLARRDEWRSHLDDAGQVEWAEDAGLRVVRGHGRLAGPRRVEVLGDDGAPARVLRARHAVVVATGSTAAVPGELRGVSPWTSRDATGVREVPGRLAIVGGGVVAVEAATWMAALGSDVQLLVRGDRLLSGQEPVASRLVLEGLVDAGVRVRFGTSVERAERADVHAESDVGVPHGGPVRLTLAGSGETLEVDELLVAAGRRPALDGLGLEALGLSAEDLQDESGTAVVTASDGAAPWLYAVGDVTGGPALTHWGKHRARLLGERIAALATGRPAPSGEEAGEGVPEVVPQVVFTSPQVARVGVTEAQAREEGGEGELRVVDVPLTSAAGAALLRDDAAGRAVLVLRGDRVVGATFVGFEVAELLHAATVAIVGEVPLDRLRHAVAAYPTASEVWLRLVEEALGRG